MSWRMDPEDFEDPEDPEYPEGRGEHVKSMPPLVEAILMALAVLQAAGMVVGAIYYAIHHR